MAQPLPEQQVVCLRRPLSRSSWQFRSQRGPDARLQLREALAGLDHPDLQQQSVFAVETLLAQVDGPVVEYFLKELFKLSGCPGHARRLRYRLGAHALRNRHNLHWGGTLLHVRDRMVERVGGEDHAPAAVELQGFMQQLTAAVIDAYCRGNYASLGHGMNEELPRGWLAQLLITPLLKAACRGPARTRVANACMLVHGVLLEFLRWSKAGSVLHATVECLKQMLKLTSSGALEVCVGEVLLPLQSCIKLLGQRLKAAAMDGILQLCTQAMQRSEWQVRKAGAETLAVLVETLAAAEGAAAPAQTGAEGAAAGAAGQLQGMAALEAIAANMVAALEQHVKYDRVPQVRQAAAAALQQLQCLPALQQQQWSPVKQWSPGKQQPQGGRGGSPPKPPARRPASAGQDAAAAAAGAQPAGQGCVRSSLQSRIADRRQQLRQAEQQQQQQVQVEVLAGPDAVRKAEAAGDGHCRSINGAGAMGGAEAGDGMIRAWGGASAQPQPAAVLHDGLESKPAIARALHASEAEEPQLEQQQTPERRPGWRTPGKPSAAGKAGPARRPSHDVPVEVFAPPVPPHLLSAPPAQHGMWVENPLAQSPQTSSSMQAPAADAADTATMAAGPASAGQEPAPQVVPCVHHIEHSQFSLRLQAVPPEADLCLASSGGTQAPVPLCSVRFWAQGSSTGKDQGDVGIEFAFAAGPGSMAPSGLHRYWLQQGKLHQEHITSADEEPPSEAVPDSPPPAHRTPKPAQPPGSRLDMPAESPLATLATEALPSFSPAKPGRRAAAADAQDSGAAAAAAAGVRSDSPTQVQHPASTRWAASLRLPGEQLLPGLPDWDRSSQPSSQPGSPGRHGSRPASRPASPSRLSHQPLPPQQLPASAQLSPTLQPQQCDSPQQHSLSPQQTPQDRTAAVGGSSRQQQQAQGGSLEQDGSGHAGPGPLTQMVTKAVSKLQQLHELQEELQLPPDAGFTSAGGTRRAGTVQQAPPVQHQPQQQRQQQQQQQQQRPRRSLDLSLSAIQEASEEERSSNSSGGQHSLTSSGSHCSDTAHQQLAARRHGAEQHAGDMARLQRLQEQLHHNMLEVQRRIKEQRAPAVAAQASAQANPAAVGGTASLESMPAAWDDQEEQLLAPGQLLSHRYGVDEREDSGAVQWHSNGLSFELEAADGAREGDDQAIQLALSNPLYGDNSRPAAAHDMHGVHGMQPALAQTRVPPHQPVETLNGGAAKQHQVAPQRQALPGTVAAGSAAREPQSPQLTGGGITTSLGSLGSGFGVLRHESEAEVQQFLRGSLAAPQQQPQQQGAATAVPAVVSAAPRAPPPAGRPPPHSKPPTGAAQAKAAAQIRNAGGSDAARLAVRPGASGPVAALYGSLDESAILGSRLSSPDRFLESSSSEECQAGNGLASNAGGGWQPDTVGAGLSAASSSDWSEAPPKRRKGHTPGSPERPRLAMHSQQQQQQQQAGVSADGPGVAAAAADLQLLRISSRPSSPGPAAEDGSSALSEVVRQSFPAEAVQRLERLKSQLSPGRQQAAAPAVQDEWQQAPASPAQPPPRAAGSRSASPDAAGTRSAGTSSGNASPARQQQQPAPPPATVYKTPKAHSSGSTGSRACSPLRKLGFEDAGTSSSSRAGSHSGSPVRQAAAFPEVPPLPKCPASPPLPELGISRREARMLESAVGRMAGNPGESADADDIQAALMDVLQQHTSIVQAHYQHAAAEQLALLQQELEVRCGQDEHLLQQVMSHEAPLLEQAREAAVREELTGFVEQALPRLAEVLSTRELLLRCFEAASEGEE